MHRCASAYVHMMCLCRQLKSTVRGVLRDGARTQYIPSFPAHAIAHACDIVDVHKLEHELTTCSTCRYMPTRACACKHMHASRRGCPLPRLGEMHELVSEYSSMPSEEIESELGGLHFRCQDCDYALKIEHAAAVSWETGMPAHTV